MDRRSSRRAQPHGRWSSDGEQGNGDDSQAYDGINEECFLECNDDQFDVLVDNVEDMIRDVKGKDEMTEADLRKYKQFVEDAKKSLYPHCEKYSWVTGDLKLLQLKAAHGWTDKSFKALLLLPKDMLQRETCSRILYMRPSRLCVQWD